MRAHSISYLPTTSITVGSVWYVVVPGTKAVQESTVREVTSQTVLLETADISLSQFGLSSEPTVTRYVTADVRWIEELK